MLFLSTQFSVLVFFGLFLRDVITAKNTVLIVGTNQELECVGNTGTGDIYFWNDVSTNTRLFIVDASGVEKTNDSKLEDKYNNFAVKDFFPQSVNLALEPVDINDGGTYGCDLVRSTNLHSYTVKLEVIPSSVDINLNGNEFVNVSESYSFTCTAVGVLSPNVLNLTWSTSTVESTPVTGRTENADNSELLDLTSTLTFTPQKDDTFIKCGITEYVNQEEINEELITDTKQLIVQYAPICTLEFGKGEAQKSGCTVTLTCNCDANPEVTAGGYSYFKDNTLIDGDGDTTTGDIKLDTTAEFSCRGRNIVGFGDQSPAEEYICSTTTTPTMTLMATSTPEPSSIVLIVVLSCFGGILVVGVAGGSVYWFCFRTPSDDRGRKKGSNTDNTDGNGVNSKLQSEPDRVEYAAVNKPESDPQPAPRSSKPPGNNTEPEKMELQYADIDHSNRGRSNEIHQPADAPTEYATVQSVIV